MNKIILRYTLFVAVAAFSTTVLHAQKASQRNMAAEIAKIKDHQSKRKNLVAKMNQGNQGNGNQPNLPPVANPPSGSRPSQGAMKPIPPRMAKKG
jgi:hypothetical protein